MAFLIPNATAKLRDLEDIKVRYSAARTVKTRWDALLQEVYRFFLPNRNLYYYNEDNQGQYKIDLVFDSTAQAAIIGFANRLQSALTPPFSKWAGLQSGPMVPEDKRTEVNQILEYVGRQLFAVIHSSNFDTAINEVYLELGIGTACLLILPGDDERPVMFIPVPLAQISIEDGPWGSVSGIFRKHKVHIRNIQQQWPDITSLPENLKKRQDEDVNAKVDILEYTYQAKLDNDRPAWVYDLICESGESRERLHHRVYSRNPWITPRWMKVAGETYGRGPAIQALPDVKTQNKAIELVLRNAALAVSGVWTFVDDGILNPGTIAIIPGAAIQVASNNTRNPSLMPLERPGDIGLGMEINEYYTTSIKKFMLDKSLPPEAGAVRSATEIIARLKELAMDSGSAFGRMYSELLVPAIQVILAIMEDRGLIDPIQVDGLAVKLVVTSPLAQEQNLSEIDAVVQWLSLMGQFGPETLNQAAAIEKIGPWIGEKLGVPSDLVRTEAQRTAMQNMLRQQMTKQLGIEEADPDLMPTATLPGSNPMALQMAA